MYTNTLFARQLIKKYRILSSCFLQTGIRVIYKLYTYGFVTTDTFSSHRPKMYQKPSKSYSHNIFTTFLENETIMV